MKFGKSLLCLLTMALLGGCDKEPEPIPVPPAPPEPSGPVDLTEFTFSHRGMAANDCFTFTVTETPEGTPLYLEQDFSGGIILDESADPSLMVQMEELAQQYNLISWDGFAETNSMISDGTGFSLHMTLADGSTISARGTNAFPAEYGSVSRTIHTLYLDHLPEEDYQ